MGEVAVIPLPKGLAQPAIRALSSAGITHLRDLSDSTERKIRALHGMGPNAMKKLTESMREHHIQFLAED